MKKLRFIMLASVTFAAFALIISCSKNTDPKDTGEFDGRREVMSDKSDVEKDTDAALLPPSPIYIMRLDGESLTLYEISGGEENPVTTVSVDTSYYPPEDIKELNKGVVAYSKEDGFLKLENFTN